MPDQDPLLPETFDIYGNLWPFPSVSIMRHVGHILWISSDQLDLNIDYRLLIID